MTFGSERGAAAHDIRQRTRLSCALHGIFLLQRPLSYSLRPRMRAQARPGSATTGYQPPGTRPTCSEPSTSQLAPFPWRFWDSSISRSRDSTPGASVVFVAKSMTAIAARVLAQVEIPESNSMIGAFWRSLRHQWLYLHDLDSLATVRRLVDFYIAEHNAVIPHAAFDGQTPDEIYFDRPSVASELSARRTAARSARLDLNRSRSCEVCRPPPTNRPTAP